MICPKCGKIVPDVDNFCDRCGYRIDSMVVYQPAKPVDKNNTVPGFVISAGILIIMSILMLPIVSIGIVDESLYFKDIMEILSEGGRIDSLAGVFALVPIILGIMLFVFSMSGNRSACFGLSLTASIIIGFSMLVFYSETNEGLASLSGANVGIGVLISLGLFIASCICCRKTSNE